jgi:predicted nucleic acid-binding protein
MSLFIDTSFLYAMEDASDLHHEESREIWKKTLKNPPRVILISFIFDETLTLLQAKLGHKRPRTLETAFFIAQSWNLST